MGKAEERARKTERQLVRMAEGHADPERYLTERFFAICWLSKDFKRAIKRLLRTKYGYTSRELDLRAYPHTNIHYGIPRRLPKRNRPCTPGWSRRSKR